MTMDQHSRGLSSNILSFLITGEAAYKAQAARTTWSALSHMTYYSRNVMFITQSRLRLIKDNFDVRLE